jgi:hypothetical protein
MVNPRYVEDNGAANLRLLALGKDYADPYPARLGLTSVLGLSSIDPCWSASFAR